jgi:hypothetical protein
VLIARAAAVAAVTFAAVAWWFFDGAGLVLSHYDAKAHLVVARRIADNITPGWQQFGGVWLPLPHLLNALPALNDWLYRTGVFASLISVACFGATAYAVARLALLLTASRLAAVVAVSLLILNPNILYLHTTPMTEPLLLAAIMLCTLWLCEWVLLNQDQVQARLGAALFLGMWTRYEAWAVVGCGLAGALWASSRLGASRYALIRRAWRLAVWPAAALALYIVNSRLTTGNWFVAGGFFVPDPMYQDQLGNSLIAVWWGTHQLSTRATEIVALGGAAALLARALLKRGDAVRVVPLALFGAALLPLYAFHEGHPFRVRYMIPLVAACALFGGVAVGTVKRQAATILAGFLVGITLVQSPPWRSDAPMIAEASWDQEASRGRQRVTACLAPAYRGEKILASMGSLAHYMQELSASGFNIADFVHEGNGSIWELAMETGPRPHAGWMLVEEAAEGGDALAMRIRNDPGFASGMERMCEGGGVALYKVTPAL